ncbi:hypothetical protein BT63DRAFT_481086 [Microthyrium microscopicum]|uniref:Gfd2/YDR514C-like C-terminal domain-containing protein n=1 Tax=Microthyrium microscopicum TaxID=703497 RepID=A0A6A6U578_9PEZI|nr:hypothetical protein BT63DRAFT_481086 [Microthyrium microscopicum]
MWSRASKTTRPKLATPYITHNGLQILRKVLRLTTESTTPNMEDVVFVAIDFEHLQNITEDLSLNLECQAGLAILDTRSFRNSQGDITKGVITTYNIATGSSRYCANAARKFKFGEAITTTQKDMLERIRSLIPPSRNIVLVGHELQNDLRCLRGLGAECDEPYVAILDTRQISQEVLPGSRHTLRHILRNLNCPHGRMHSAGNDAHFTLRALLLLAVRDCKERKDVNHQQGEEILHMLESIAHAPVPFSISPGGLAERNRIRLEANRRERKIEREKNMSPEKQAQKRADKTLKKLERESQEALLLRLHGLCFLDSP